MKKKEEAVEQIVISKARVHNLKNISLSLPRDTFIVITGLSGSGKSSLAFDTLYAEGQRRYVESLSSYARQFLGKIHKPDVDFIKGIPPAIAIEQKVNARNPRSTVGTSTEIYDYLKLLYARVGHTFSPISNVEVKKHTVDDVINKILSFPNQSQVIILLPLSLHSHKTDKAVLEFLIKEGISALELNGKIFRIKEIQENPKAIKGLAKMNIVVDRFRVSHEPDDISRMADSVQTAFAEGNGDFILRVGEDEKSKNLSFSSRFEMDGIIFEEPDVNLFSFNSPLGACSVCEGYGRVIGVDENLVIPDKNLSVYEDAVVCWKGEKMSQWKEFFISHASKLGFPVHKPYFELKNEQKELLWNGNKQIEGIYTFFEYLETKKYKIQYRVMLARYRGKTTCPSCKGSRLRKEAAYVKVSDTSIQHLVDMPILELINFFKKIKFNDQDKKISHHILFEITSRLEFLSNVGLGYLTLNRLSSSLSGGESQRINLSCSLGSSLVGSLYILDEPSIGLHPRDTGLLIGVLKKLTEIGNTVVVVEHDEEIIKAAEHIIDIGPFAGRLGGEIVFQGNFSELLKEKNGLTAAYFSKREMIPLPISRRKWNSYIEINGARENNLKDITVRIPLNVITVVTGVSGSGKSSLIGDILYPALSSRINATGIKVGEHTSIKGDVHRISQIEYIDQNPIGKSSRSNPVTYIKAYDEIRKLFSLQQHSKTMGYEPSHFSFNVAGGRCDECDGEGEITIEMQFMADVKLVCDSCHGRRFKDEVLEVKYHGRSIHDVLEMTIDEAVEFFKENQGNTESRIIDKLQTLLDVGLGYIRLGQSSNTLSGGESQRVKLASFLVKGTAIKPHLFIFDEPTTGLHIHDIRKLLDSFNALLRQGHSIVIIEHNPEVIKCADWVIDLGPEGGDKGGYLVFEGIPEDLAKFKSSYTGKYLKEKMIL